MNFQSRVFSNLDFSTSDLNRIEILGVFGLENNRLNMKSQLLPSPGLVVDIDAAVSIKPELLDLKKLHLSLGKNNLIKVSGSVANFAKDPSFRLMLKEASFQLEDLLDWAKQWLPPISGKGQLKVARVNVKGHLSDSSLKNLNINGGTLSTKNLWINHPAQTTQLEDVNVNLKFKEVVLHNSQVEKVSLDLNMQLKKARIKDAEIKNWKQFLDITAKGKDLRNILLQFSSDMESLHYNHPETKELSLPVHVEGSGHIIKNDFNNLKLSYRLGNLVNGEVTGTVKGLGKASIQMDQNFKINLAELADRLPTNLTTKLVEKLQGTAQGQASVTGKLDEKFFPVELNGQANFQLEGLTVNLKNPDISIKNLNTRVSFPLEFNAKKGVRIPQLDIHTNLQDAKVLDTFQINDLEIKNQTKIQGFHNLKPEFGTLPVQIDTQISLGSFSSNQPAISLAHLKSDTVLKTDLKANDVRNTRAEGNLTFKDLSAMEKIKIAEWFSQFKLDVHDKSLTRVRISQKNQNP